jgi:hypothetical protein
VADRFLPYWASEQRRSSDAVGRGGGGETGIVPGVRGEHRHLIGLARLGGCGGSGGFRAGEEGLDEFAFVEGDGSVQAVFDLGFRVDAELGVDRGA